MTLIGLTTAIGVLVDDSIVVLENIFTHLERGKESKQAAIDGRSEIGMAAIAITLVDVAVWGPIIFITRHHRGVPAQLRHRDGGGDAGLAAGQLHPDAADRLALAASGGAEASERSLARRGSARVLGAALRALASAPTRGSLHWSLRHRPIVLLLARGGVRDQLRGAAAPGHRVRARDQPRQRDAWWASCRPARRSRRPTGRRKRWELALLDKNRFPEIETAYVVVGRGDSDFDLEPRFISVTLDLGRAARRGTRTSNEIGKAAADAGEQMVPGLQARLGGGRAGGTASRSQVRIFGDDLDS